MTHFISFVDVYPPPWPLLVGESDLPAYSLPAIISVYLASSAVIPGSVDKSRGDNVVEVEEMVYGVCVSVT